MKSMQILETIDFVLKEYRYIIIDEAQDFNKDIIKLIYDKAVENNKNWLYFMIKIN